MPRKYFKAFVDRIATGQRPCGFDDSQLCRLYVEAVVCYQHLFGPSFCQKTPELSPNLFSWINFHVHKFYFCFNLVDADIPVAICIYLPLKPCRLNATTASWLKIVQNEKGTLNCNGSSSQRVVAARSCLATRCRPMVVAGTSIRCNELSHNELLATRCRATSWSHRVVVYSVTVMITL